MKLTISRQSKECILVSEFTFTDIKGISNRRKYNFTLFQNCETGSNYFQMPFKCLSNEPKFKLFSNVKMFELKEKIGEESKITLKNSAWKIEFKIWFLNFTSKCNVKNPVQNSTSKSNLKITAQKASWFQNYTNTSSFTLPSSSSSSPRFGNSVPQFELKAEDKKN